MTDLSNMPIETTGRYLVLLPQEDVNGGIHALVYSSGVHDVARANDFSGNVTAEQLESEGAVVFDRLGVAVVSLDPNQAQSLRATVASERPVLAIAPERVVYALEGLSAEYLKGYRDAINHLVDRAVPAEQQQVSASEFTDGETT